jgi:hypothetical protein
MLRSIQASYKIETLRFESSLVIVEMSLPFCRCCRRPKEKKCQIEKKIVEAFQNIETFINRTAHIRHLCRI